MTAARVPRRTGSPLRLTLDRLVYAGLYALVLIAPLAMISHVVKAGAQGSVVVFSDAVGFGALSLLALQVVVSGRWAGTTRAFGLRPVLSLHRQAGKTVLVLVVFHVAILLADDPARLALLDSFTAPPRARAGMLATLGLFALAGTSIFRERLRLSYEHWRGLHLVLTAVVLGAAFAHVVWVDAFTANPLVRWSVLALVLTAAGALFWTRFAHPYAATQRPYRVRSVRRERGNAVTLELEAEDHHGLHFAPGQFARLRAPGSIYGMAEHPFSLSSSAHDPDRPAFTVKALGDFSSAVAHLPLGTQVFVDGPHGEHAHDGPRVRGRLLVAAGIGITPALSVLRTAAEGGDHRPVVLIYGSRRWEDITFREELDDLRRRMSALTVVHVLSQPPAAWGGERGRIREDVLGRHTPRHLDRWSALVCGPAAMVEQTTETLRALGMRRGAIQAEGFG
ncbi:MAG: ferredoxin reductase family protein [Solirubrobacteraceae bacterium]|nr:ferredoxin reductase family protein [Patulibacter sp.]